MKASRLNFAPSDPWYHPFASARDKWQNDANQFYRALKLGTRKTHDQPCLRFELKRLAHQGTTPAPAVVSKVAEELRKI